MHNAKKITEKLLETQRLISEEIEESEEKGNREGKFLLRARGGVRTALTNIRDAQLIHDFGTLDE